MAGLRRLTATIAVMLVLGGCYTTTTRVADRSAAWPALAGTYDVAILKPGEEPDRKRWVFEADGDGYVLAGVAPRPLDTVVVELYDEVRVIQVDDGRGKFLLMVVRPTAEGFEALLHEGIETLAAGHGVEAVPLDLGYQLNGTAEDILSTLRETRTREARTIIVAVRQ